MTDPELHARVNQFWTQDATARAALLKLQQDLRAGDPRLLTSPLTVVGGTTSDARWFLSEIGRVGGADHVLVDLSTFSVVEAERRVDQAIAQLSSRSKPTYLGLVLRAPKNDDYLVPLVSLFVRDEVMPDAQDALADQVALILFFPGVETLDPSLFKDARALWTYLRREMNVGAFFDGIGDPNYDLSRVVIRAPRRPGCVGDL